MTETLAASPNGAADPSRAGDAAASPGRLPLRRRGDLVIVERPAAGESRWTVKDPVALRFFDLGAHEHFVLMQLDGQVSAEELEARFGRTFAPQRVARQQVLEFVGRLWQQGLVTSLAPGAGAALHARCVAQESPSLASRLSGLLSFRARGVDPDRFLGWLHGRLAWIFSPSVVGLAALFVASAALLVAIEWDTVLRRLPDLQSFLNVRDLVTGALMLGGIKVLHELGHALTCKHFGGECHELGFLWLIVTPALYCNVSDAWLFRSRWQRAAVSGAGIFVELVLAALFTFLWYFSEPGRFHDACFWGMTIGSVNTLLINGNPLLRYDGYYVLSDLVDVPNLRTRSQRELGRTLAGWVFGIRSRKHERPAGRPLLLSFGLASWLYGWVVLIGILWFLYHLARPVGLDPLVVGFAAAMLGMRLLGGLVRGITLFRNWRGGGQVRTLRFLAGLALLAAGGWALATWPFPHTVRGATILVRSDARTLFAVTPGFLDSTAPAGAIAAGEPVFQLTNPDLELEILKLQGTVERHQTVVDNLTKRVVSEPHLSAQLAAAQAALADQTERYRTRRGEGERLRVLAPLAGQWRPLPLAESNGPLAAERNLRHANWADPRLAGTWVTAGTPLAEISPSGAIEARVFVEQSEIPFVQAGQPVRVRIPQAPGGVLEGRVSEVATRNVESIPPELALRKQVAGHPQQNSGGAAGSKIVPQDVLYEVRVTLDGAPALLAAKDSGEAKITVGTLSPWRRFVRFLNLTFRIREAGP